MTRLGLRCNRREAFRSSGDDNLGSPARFRQGKTEKRQLQRGLAALDTSRLLGMVVNSCSGTDNKNYYSRYGSAAAGPQGAA